MGIGVIPIPIYVRFNSFPFHSHSQIGVLFPFPLNSNAIPIPTGNPIPAVTSLAWCTHVSGGCAVAVVWLAVATWSRHAGWCDRLTSERRAGKLTRRVTAARHHVGTVRTFRTRQAALVQTDRATRYGPNSVTSICCGFDVQNHNNQQLIHNRSTANRTPTANRQHLKLHSTSRTSCKLVAHPSCQLVGKLHHESKKQDTILLAITSSDFQNFFTSRLCSKFATNSCLNIPPALNTSLHYLVKYECRKTASFWNTYCN